MSSLNIKNRLMNINNTFKISLSFKLIKFALNKHKHAKVQVTKFNAFTEQ